tara:strand:- start:423 stop:1406 length:984 start_codon:yes stop_codon:yes gene_type:complete
MSYVLSTATDNSKLIYINSADATQVFSSADAVFKYDLENVIDSPDTEDLLISLYSCVIPYSFYNIRKDINDTILFTNLTGSGAASVSFQIPAGNYTTSSLGVVIKTQLQALVFTSGTYFVTYDRTKMKFRYFATGISVNQVAIDLSTTTKAPFIELGFAEGESKIIKLGDADAPVDEEYSTNVPDVNGSVHTVQIRTTLSTKGCYDSINKSYSSILGTIPIDVNFGGIIFQNPRDNKHKILISTHSIKSFTVRLTDDRGRNINMNGLNFSIGIQVDSITKQKKVNPMNREERRIQENHVAMLPPQVPKVKKVKKPKTKKELESELLN